nr:hypothetical protein [Tanacetum cinerariifolium]
MLPVAPPSPDYIPGLEELQTPPTPQDEDEHELVFIQPHDSNFMPEPIYPEYIPLEDEHILSAEEQPLPPVVSPTTESPGYVAKSDPEEDPEEYEDDEIEDGLVNYPMDGGDDGDDDDGNSSGYDADDEDKENEEEEEEEEHLAPADSTVVIPIDELASPPEGTEPIIPPPSIDTATTGARITIRLQIMALVTRQGQNPPPPNTDTLPHHMTSELVQAMIDQAILRNSTNGDGSQSLHEDNPRHVQTTRPCFYSDFMKCHPLNFKGNEGVVGLTQWIKKTESIFNISGCAIENQVKFATCTLLDAALTWWNCQIRTLGPDAYFVANENEKIDKYISRLPDKIYENVKSSKPRTLDETIELTNDLMDQKLRTYPERADNNRKTDDTSRNNHGHQQQPFKKQNVTKVYNMGTRERKPYEGSLPKITGRLQAAISLLPEAEVEILLAMPSPIPSPLATLSPPSAGERLARCTAPSACPSPPPMPSPLLQSFGCPT